MKNWIILSFLIIGMKQQLQAQKLEKFWSTEKIFKVPESVLFDEGEQVLYVSNIDGASGEKDGKGFISKMKPDGKIIVAEWAKGLNAPKGMVSYLEYLFVTDIDNIVMIEKKSGMVMRKIPVEAAIFLNDITVDPSGIFYFSDSDAGVIYKMVGQKRPEPFITGRTRPNGVLWHNNRLFFVDAGALFSYQNGTTKQIASGMEKSTDGIEPVDNERLLVSSWIGTMYLVHTKGTVKEILNTKEQKINCADIGYDRKKKIVYAPTFNDNRVTAYKVAL